MSKKFYITSCRKVVSFIVMIALLLTGIPLFGGGLTAPDEAHAASLDPPSLTSEAKKSKLTPTPPGPSGNKGADGFVLHNPRGDNGYTSFSKPNRALVVDDEYAYKPSASWRDPATGTLHEAKFSYFGTKMSETQAHNFFTDWVAAAATGSTTDETYAYFFNTKNSNVQPGTFGIKVDGMWLKQGVGNSNPPIELDLVVTCVDFTVEGIE